MRQVEEARALAEALLAEPLPRRWAHTQGVAATARRLAPVLGDDAALIETAAWLHDIGYAPSLARVGFHPLDGARYLRDSEQADPILCGLVAYHTGAIHEARLRGLAGDLEGEFTPAPQPLADAVTYCDITTSPDGNNVDVEARLTDIHARYGEDHPVSRAVAAASPSLLSSVRAIEARLTG